MGLLVSSSPFLREMLPSPGFAVNGFIPWFCVMMVPGSLHRALVASQGFHTGDL